jgi:hypothetical protein
MGSRLCRLGGTSAVVLLSGPAVWALPTMVRLGYVNCAACHFSPQGGGPLNTYGRGIDKAQSLVGGEYEPSDSGLSRALSFSGRVSQDLRTVMQEQVSWAGESRGTSLFRPRLMYRNVTSLGRAFRLSATVTADGERVPRPPLDYDPPARPSTVFVNTGLVHYRPAETLEFAAGRDLLPTGVNVPDLGVYVRSRNRLGYYDTPTQVKAYWWGRRHAVMPFAYGPGGNERTGEREWGGGALVEYDVLGRQKTVLGLSALAASAPNGDRRMLGVYARLGFGRWGILAEHDVTERRRTTPDEAGSFRQYTSYAQLFWAVREWFVASLIGERLRVASPFGQHLLAGRFEVAARLAPQATVVASSRLERNMDTHRLNRSISLQLALKTVN